MEKQIKEISRTSSHSRNIWTRWREPKSVPALPSLVGALFLFVPPLLGAKGCDVADIGDNEPSGDICGVRGASACAADKFCLFPVSANCGASDEPGTCEDRPEVCPEIYAPVCGCDGVTYPSACVAHGRGVSVVAEGACEGSGGQVCGGLAGDRCESDEFCNYPRSAQCGTADATGVCKPKPEACDLVYSPVCGCDGVVYGNACDAHLNGVSVTEDELCARNEVPCGDPDDAACPDNQFCAFAAEASCGADGARGVCQNRPEVCPLIYAPVCGCDGKTYGSACEAGSYGVSIASDGPCPGTVCGGLSGAECTEGEFCDYGEGCGEADQSGTCVKTPEICADIYEPVCGCDGKTYGNACEARGAGQSIVRVGACEEEPARSCGGIAGVECAKGEYCNFSPETACGSGDQMGTCATRPEGCTKEYAPVCGCDGMTYGNACAAASAGVSIQADGSCEGNGSVCGGFRGLACEENEFCNFDPDAGCGFADATGTCSQRPEVCTQEYAPVCGCDGKTYSNRCTAHGNGVSVASTGECEG